MEPRRIREQIGFYQNELTNNLLHFWLPDCEDRECGGYFNCYDNTGRYRVSEDKYLWSQGRFVWIFSRLATMKGDIFTRARQQEFLRLAASGRDFILQHSLVAENDWRCVFLTDRCGKPRRLPGYDRLDLSIFADCFVNLGLSRYALAAGDPEAYRFAASLYESILERIRQGRFYTLPYPLSSGYRAHSIPMILAHTTAEMHQAAERFEPAVLPRLQEQLRRQAEDVLNHFIDEHNVLHEVISADNRPVAGLLGEHCNPGHALEDIWFLCESADILGEASWKPRLAAVAAKMLQLGWDEKYGGLFHYCPARGRDWPLPAEKDMKEPIVSQVRQGWSNKLWWVHSEALYTTLLCYDQTGDELFLNWYDRVFDYTFATFPNPDREIREWVQIRSRDGKPYDQVVALPVKDPYHIIRNLIMLLELLQKMQVKPAGQPEPNPTGSVRPKE